MLRVVVGSDKSGFLLKEAVKKNLMEQGYQVEDCGTLDMEIPMPFYEVAPIAAQKIQNQSVDRAILFCGTGMGMAIVANKYKGVYAAVVESTYAAEKCRAINDAKILTMGGWMIGEFLGIEIANTFLKTEFTQGLEEWRQAFLIKARETVISVEKQAFEANQKFYE